MASRINPVIERAQFDEVRCLHPTPLTYLPSEVTVTNLEWVNEVPAARNSTLSGFRMFRTRSPNVDHEAPAFL